MSAVVLLENDQLRIIVDPMVGGTIRSIEHRGLGLSVLGKVPWKAETTPLDPAEVHPSISELGQELVHRRPVEFPDRPVGKLSMGVGGINACVISRPWDESVKPRG